MPNGTVEWFDAYGVLFKRVTGSQTQWLDENGHWHREDGPAWDDADPNGTRVWFVHGKEHREDGPAVEGKDFKRWYRNGKLHRDEGPAVEEADGRSFWYRNGRKLKPEQIKRLQEKNALKVGEPFKSGLDHDVTVSKPLTLKKR